MSQIGFRKILDTGDAGIHCKLAFLLASDMASCCAQYDEPTLCSSLRFHLKLRMWQWALYGRHFPQPVVSVCHRKSSNSIYGFMHCYISRNKNMSNYFIILPQNMVQTWKGPFSNSIFKFLFFPKEALTISNWKNTLWVHKS